MIFRLVKMTFKEPEVDNFLELFHAVKDKIKNRQGCTHLELWQQKELPAVIFTFSIWEDEDCLEAYRNSDLFKDTWAKTKIKFSDKPEAWSVEQLVSSNHNIFK